MTAIILHRSNPRRNMHRYYRLDVQRDFFGQWCCIREWGRLGQAGQTRSASFSTPAEAEAALAQQWHVKERKGYKNPSLGQL